MAASQFRIYTSQDPQGPGLLMGTTGSLVTILDAVLVNGYGTGQYLKPAAGWTKPLTNISQSAAGSASVACYQPPSGSRMTLFVNDAGPNSSAGPREAWICGFEQITSLSASNFPAGGQFSASFGNGTGFGQFPLPAQQLTYGHVLARKSNTSDTTGRFWVIAADAYTMYMWILTGDVAASYFHWAFGDFFSLRGAADTYRCMVMGRMVENTATAAATTADWTFVVANGTNGTSGIGSVLANFGTIQPGHWIVRSMSGTAGSIGFAKRGCPEGSSTAYAGVPGGGPLNGSLLTPNPADNSLYFAPLQICEAPGAIRGRLRGLFQLAHAAANFSDGQQISGGGDYSGKTFNIIKFAADAAGFWALETSATVETN